MHTETVVGWIADCCLLFEKSFACQRCQINNNVFYFMECFCCWFLCVRLMHFKIAQLMVKM